MIQDLLSIDYSKHFSMLQSDHKRSIASPLQLLNINHFSYLKINKDDSRYLLTTNPEFAVKFAEEKFYLDGLSSTYDAYKPGYWLWEIIQAPRIYAALHEVFWAWSGVLIIRKNVDILSNC